MDALSFFSREGRERNESSAEILEEIRGVKAGLALLSQKVGDANYASASTPWRVLQREGLTFFLDTRSLVDKCIIDSGYWEKEQVDYLCSLLNRIGAAESFWFLDIGAYFGYYSLILKHKYPNCNVLAFEANPMTFIQLRTNLLCNNFQEKITAMNAVVSSQGGKTNVANHEQSLDNRGSWSLAFDSGGAGSPVENVVIDEFLPFLKDQWVVVKIDVEGYEAKVIPGLRKLIKNNKVILQIECFDFDDGFRTKFQDVIRDLGLVKVNQIQYDHYYVSFPGEAYIENPKPIFVPGAKFFSGLSRDESGSIPFDENVVGHIVYGPCMWVPKGRQKVVFQFSKGTVLDKCVVDVFSEYASSHGQNGLFHEEKVSGDNYDPQTGRLAITYDNPIAFCDIQFRIVTHGQARGKFLSAEIVPQFSKYDWW